MAEEQEDNLHTQEVNKKRNWQNTQTTFVPNEKGLFDIGDVNEVVTPSEDGITG